MPIRPPRWLQLVSLLAAPAVFAQAGTPPPPWPVSKDSPVELTTDPVRPLLLGTQRITLDGTTLNGARQTIGLGTSQRQGSGTEALDWLCYTLPDAGGPQRLWLTSSELSRGRIDAVIAADLPAGTAATPDCPELPAKFRPVRFDDGLWLGTPSNELRRALGIPPKWAGPRFASLFHGEQGNLHLVSSTVIEFRGPRAVTLHVAHSSQN